MKQKVEGLPGEIHEFLNRHLNPFPQEIAIAALRIIFRDDPSQFQLDKYSSRSWSSDLMGKIRQAYLTKNLDLADKLKEEYYRIKEEKYPTLAE